MSRRALRLLVVLTACGCASPPRSDVDAPPADVAETDAPGDAPAGPGDVALGAGYLHLAAAGDETRYESAWSSLEMGLRPWAATDPEAPGRGLQAGVHAGLDVLRFSSRSYSGTRASPALGVDLLWTDAPLDDLVYTITLRPHVAGSFERSEVSAQVGDEDRDTALLAVDLLASFYRLAAPPEGSRVTWFPETHLRAVFEHDLDPDRYAADRSGAGLVAAPARRAGGGGGPTVTPGSAALEGDRRDLSRVLVEVTHYALRLDAAPLELALGVTAGLSRTRAFYYLGVDDGDPVHSVYGGPVLRLRATSGLWLIAACPLLLEVETDRWGPTPSLTLLWAF